MKHERLHYVRALRPVNERPLKWRFRGEVPDPATRAGMRPRRVSNKPAVRRGAMLLVVLICLLLVSMIGATMMSIASSQRRQQQSSRFRLQAESLAVSAVGRAAAQLARDPGYTGETWEPEADAFQGKSRGVARIVVVADENVPQRRYVEAVADFPHAGDRRARSHRKITIDL